MRVQAIETTYRGYRFRSRLEARWAVFFDALGVQWQYEPQGFLVGGTPYLPDFYLPEHGTWVEVKGRIDQAKVLELAVAATDGFSGGNLPFYCPKVPAEYAEKPSNRDDWLNTEYGSSLGLLIVGEIPDPSRELIGHDLFVSHKGALREPHYFTTGPRLLEPINCVDAYIHCYDITRRAGVLHASRLLGHRLESLQPARPVRVLETPRRPALAAGCAGRLQQSPQSPLRARPDPLTHN